LKTVLCFGDSNTWGSATVPGNDIRYPFEKRWPAVTAAVLGDGWNVIAEGLPGRTTVHPDPVEGPWLDGSLYLLPCLRTHRPLDVVVIMLGTNDLKKRFSVSPSDIAGGIGMLLSIVKRSGSGPAGGVPQVLVVCPPPIRDSFGTRPEFAEIFEGGREKSLHLGPRYAVTAREYGANLLNAGDLIESSEFDGIHLDAEAHAIIGRAIADAVLRMV
jgi:lysophospholipase L1-like esterase